MGHVVLFVDDEQKVLDSVRRTLHGSDFRMEIAVGGREGVKKCQQIAPSVIVTDMRMPEMDGVTFLQEARKLHPEAVCMVMSAYSDLDKIMSAINEQHIWRYITKPWETEDLKLAIQNAMEMFEYRDGKKKLEASLEELLATLEEKNRQIEEMNSLLEEKVKERTLQLREKNEILQMLVEDATTAEVMKKICLAIAHHLCVSPVFIDVPFLPASFSGTDEPLPAELKSIGEKAMQDGKEITAASCIAKPLVKGESALGSLLITHPEKVNGQKLADAVGNYLPAAILCLMQAKYGVKH